MRRLTETSEEEIWSYEGRGDDIATLLNALTMDIWSAAPTEQWIDISHGKVRFPYGKVNWSRTIKRGAQHYFRITHDLYAARVQALTGREFEHIRGLAEAIQNFRPDQSGNLNVLAWIETLLREIQFLSERLALSLETQRRTEASRRRAASKAGRIGGGAAKTRKAEVWRQPSRELIHNRGTNLQDLPRRKQREAVKANLKRLKLPIPGDQSIDNLLRSELKVPVYKTGGGNKPQRRQGAKGHA